MKKYLDEALSAQERAEALVDEMTVEEMASQLKYDSEAIERLGIPAYNWWNEGLHGLSRSGISTLFPQAIGLAATFDRELLHTAGEITGIEARAKYKWYSKYGDVDKFKGITIWSPNINIFRDPRWGRGQETYGEDPYLTAELGVQYVRGIQGDGEKLRAAACAKHLAAHSGPEETRHGFNAKVSEKDLNETYLPAFERLVKDAKVEGVMGAYNAVNGEPSCASPYLMQKLKDWGFDGYFVSDCWAIRDFHEAHHITREPKQSASLAIKAGCDVNCGCTYEHLLTAYNEGLISKEEIRTACVHAMRTRIRLGMFDKKPPYDYPYSIVACAQHKAQSLKAAQESIVLLKNNGILPLDEKRIKTIAVIGPEADSRTALEGNYTPKADRYITLLEGIQDRFTGRTIFAEGCHLYQDRVSQICLAGDRYSEALAAAENSDVIIACVGLDSTIEGEQGDAGNEYSSGDKPDLMLPQSQRILLEKLRQTGKPLVIVCTAGGSMNMLTDADAIIHAWYPGSEGGKALAQILFGDISPSGKLPVTFYETADKLPDFEDYSMQGRTYRYAKDNILYPFGYGLTYSKVRLSNLSYADFTATVDIENIGERDISEVVQVYINDTCEFAAPNPKLCGFERVQLAKGEKKTLTLSLDKNMFTAVNERGERKVFSKQFTLYAGVSQPDKFSRDLCGTACEKVLVKI